MERTQGRGAHSDGSVAQVTIWFRLEIVWCRDRFGRPNLGGKLSCGGQESTPYARRHCGLRVTSKQGCTLIEIWALGFAAGLALAIPVGPMAIMLVQTATTRGWRHGATGAFAMASVDMVYALVVFMVGGAIVGFLRDWGTALTLAGAAILLWLGWQTLSTNIRRLRANEARTASRDTSNGSLWRTYLTFAGATVVNPPTALYFLAIAPTVARTASATGDTAVQSQLAGLIFAVGVFVGSVIWQQTLAAGGTLLRKVSTVKFQAGTGIVGGAMIVGLAIALVVKGLA